MSHFPAVLNTKQISILKKVNIMISIGKYLENPQLSIYAVIHKMLPKQKEKKKETIYVGKIKLLISNDDI